MTPQFDANALARLTDVFNIVAAPPTPMLSDALTPAQLAQTAEDLYALATSPNAEDNLRQLLSAFDEKKLTAILDNVKAELATPQVAATLASHLKTALNSTTNEELLAQMQAGMQPRDPMERMMMNMMIAQTLPVIDAVRAMPEAEIAGQIVALVQQIPSRQIAQKLAELSGNGGNKPPKPPLFGKFNM